jgi:hypothetical protein
LMGSIVIASSFLSIFINIPCHAGLIWGEDNHAVIQARERYLQRREMARQQEAGETANTEGNADVEESSPQLELKSVENESDGSQKNSSNDDTTEQKREQVLTA